MRVVALYRVSTERQAEQGASLQAQQRRSHELAAQQGWSIVAEYFGSESATQASSDRQVLQRVLGCIRETRPDALYVHEQSRLTRGDELEVAMLLRELRESQIKIIVNGVIRDLASIDERFMVGIQGLVDRAESERIRERNLRGKREKAKQGRWSTGKAPFGYVNPLIGDGQRGKLRIVPEQAVVVRRVFEAASKGMGSRAIAAMLNAENIPAPRGERWAKSSVQSMLANRVYLGVIASNVWQPVRKGSRTFVRNYDAADAITVADAHPAIIDAELWNKVHERHRAPSTRKPRLLCGLVRLNGHKASGDMADGRRVYRTHRVGMPWLDEAETNQAVWLALRHVLDRPTVIQACLSATPVRAEQQALIEELRACEANRLRLCKRAERLLELRLDGEIGAGVFAERKQAIASAIAATDQRAAMLRERVDVYDPGRVKHALHAMQAMLHPAATMTPGEQSSLLRGLLRSIDVEATRSQRCHPRDALGRIVSGQAVRWTIHQIHLEFRVQPHPGRVDTTSCSWARLAVAKP